MQHNLSEILLRNKLADFLSRRTSLSAFHEWFVSTTWDIDESAPPRLRELVYEIKLRLAEYSSGHWTKDDLRTKLLPLVNAGFYTVGEARSRTVRSSTYTVLTTGRLVTSPLPALAAAGWLAHIEHAEAYG